MDVVKFAPTGDQLHELSLAAERLNEKKKEIRKRRTVLRSATAAPRPPGYVEDDPLITPFDMEWVGEIEPENSAFNEVILKVLASAPKLDTTGFVKLGGDNLWVWGGPTPAWGGTMAEDTLIRGADYFNAENVVYVYGPTTEKMLGIHSKYKRMICQINTNCRTRVDDVPYASDEENAEYLSRLSLKYPNITGAMCDDVMIDYDKVILPEKFEARTRALKKYNPELKMWCVAYEHDFIHNHKDFRYVLPYVDGINLYIWSKDQILRFDETIELCRLSLPGKPILLGVFLHDYGRSDAGTPPELLIYELDKAREYLTAGLIEGVVILGDREIKKWPEQAETIRNYLMNQ